MTDKQPVYILPENVSRTIGRDAQRNNILAAKIISNILKTTLGPRGMDKMIVNSSGEIIITNDGATIIKEMNIDHPAAKIMVEIAKTQELEVGDGTTTAVLLAGKLLENSEKLIDKNIHPTLIIKGYNLAVEKSNSILREISHTIDNIKILEKIAQTAMTGKCAEEEKDKLAEIIVRAVDSVAIGKNIDKDNIKIEKNHGGSIKDSNLIRGVVLDKEKVNMDMPSKVEKSRILLVDMPLELRNPESETKISVSTPEQLENFIKSEERYLKEMTDKIIRLGVNVVFCQKGIDDVAQYYLAKTGIFACRRVSKLDMEKVSKATGAKIISSLSDLSEKVLGSSEIVEEIKKGEDSLIYIRECRNPHIVSILIGGGTDHLLDEVERAVKDGLGDVISAFKNGKIVAGGGAVEIELSRRIRIFAKSQSGRTRLVIEEFANSLESIPISLAENAGMDQLDVLSELKRLHDSGLYNQGINLFNDKIGDNFSIGIIEPTKIKEKAIQYAYEVASMILRIDDVLISEDIQNPTKSNQFKEID